MKSSRKQNGSKSGNAGTAFYRKWANASAPTVQCHKHRFTLAAGFAPLELRYAVARLSTTVEHARIHP
jgi:hypothetical protein